MSNEYSVTKRYEVRVLLQKMKDGVIKELSANVDPKLGITYPDAEAELKDNVQATLEALYQEGFLLKEQKENVMLCRRCNGASFKVAHSCPNCDSLNLKKGMVVQHLTCGYTDLESVFIEYKYTCPKCKKKLRALGVDYVKPGIQYVCKNCGNVTQDPIILLKCWTCGELQTMDDAKYVEVNTYMLDYSRRELLAKVTFNLTPVIQRVYALGWVAKKDYKIRGKSGIEHTFTLGLWPHGRDLREVPEVVVDVRMDVVEDVHVLALYAKILDTGIENAILAAIPVASEKAKVLAKYYEINIVEAEDTDILIEKLALAIEDTIKSYY